MPDDANNKAFLDRYLALRTLRDNVFYQKPLTYNSLDFADDIPGPARGASLWFSDLLPSIGTLSRDPEQRRTQIATALEKVKASKAYNFLENVKISKNSIWYILVEKQDNELQMVKYNNKKGFDMAKFVLELKTFYLNQYKDSAEMSNLIESIEVGGAEEFSSIKNIPNVEIEPGKKLITKITEDLIKLLSK